MIHLGDCLTVMRTFEAESVDAIVTDPPSGIHFMQKSWDHHKGGRTQWVAWMTEVMTECYRVLKPGGYAVVWSLPRTCHWTAWAMEDAGFIIRDQLAHIFASGFPKGRAQLKPAREDWWLARKPGPLQALNIEETRIGTEKDWPASPSENRSTYGKFNGREWPASDRPTAKMDIWEHDASLCAFCAADAENQEKPGTPATRGSTTPKPAEPQPSEPETSGDTSKAGTGCSDGTTPDDTGTSSSTAESGSKPTGRSRRATSSTTSTATSSTTGSRTCPSCGAISTATTTTDDTTSTPSDPPKPTTPSEATTAGRWPSNVLLSDPELFDQANPWVVGSGATSDPKNGGNGSGDEDWFGGGVPWDKARLYADSGGYSRFFKIPRKDATDAGSSGADTGNDGDSDVRGNDGGYPSAFLIPKADRADREPVLRGQLAEQPREGQYASIQDGRPHTPEGYVYDRKPRENTHSTVKPVALMRHLVRLVTPPRNSEGELGLVLDPFLGSGTTAIACELEGFPWIGIEKEPEYVAIAEARLNGTQRGLGLDVPAPTTQKKPSTSPARRTPHKSEGWGFSGGQEGLEERYEKPPEAGEKLPCCGHEDLAHWVTETEQGCSMCECQDRGPWPLVAA